MCEEKHNDEWEGLRSAVIDAIKKHDAFSIDFSSKDIYQCKFQQKCADVEKSDYTLIWAAVIFMFAGATQLISKFKIDIDITSAMQVIIGFILIGIGFFIKNRLWTPEYNTCKEIIINAEKQIQKLTKEESLQEKDQSIIA